MKIDWIRLMGLMVTIGLVLVFALFIMQVKIIHLGTPSELVTSRAEAINWRIDIIIWHRLLDVAAAVFVVFATVTCCLSLLRPAESD